MLKHFDWTEVTRIIVTYLLSWGKFLNSVDQVCSNRLRDCDAFLKIRHLMINYPQLHWIMGQLEFDAVSWSPVAVHSLERLREGITDLGQLLSCLSCRVSVCLGSWENPWDEEN